MKTTSESKIIIVVALVAIALLLFGCTSQPIQTPAGNDNNTPQASIDITPQPGTPANGNGNGTAAPEASTPSHTVYIQNFHFNPQSVTISIGDKVIWTNFDGAQHQVVSDTGVFDSGLMPQGQTFEYVFSAAGTYNYHCSVHPSMTGTIVVQ